MRRLFFVALLVPTLSTFAQIPSGYYDTADGLSGDPLKTALYDIIKGHTEFPYSSSSTDTWDIIKLTDQDPSDPTKVVCIYSGFTRDAAAEYNSGAGWNREHVWAKSRGDFGTTKGAGTDLHHLRAADVSTNSARSNRNFNDPCDSQYVDGDGTTDSYTCTGEFSWEPRDEVKGDVARMLFYMATRYEGENGEPDLELTETLQGNTSKDPLHAILSVLIDWHNADPVSSTETSRNDIIYSYQGNRNPFIDHPEYVALIWGSGSSTTPTINASPTSLDFGNVVFGNSSIQNYTVSGVNLTNDITITPPAEYELSLVSDFSSTIYNSGSPLTLTQSSGTVASTTIYVRFTPPSASGLNYNGNITHTSTGATQVDVGVTGIEGVNTTPNAWINEVHYDDASTDEDEMIEVVIQDTGWDLSLFTITLYNGGDNSSYATYTISADYTLGDQSGNFKVYYDILPVNGIQNGPDGIALSYNGTLLQFLSYEGVFTAADGVASGVASTNIGVSEGGSDAPGSSLQLTNSGSSDADFSWTGPTTDSPGSFNTGQSISNGITLLPTTLDFGLVNFGTTSSNRSYTVQGSGLSNDIVVTPPADFEIALESDFSGSIYSNILPLTLTATGGEVSTTTVYVRFTPPANDKAVSSGNITHVSGSFSENVSVTGQEGSFPNAWINEIHYDNVSTDVGEFFEIVIEDASEFAPLTDFTVTLYNGGNGTSYGSYDIDPDNASVDGDTIDNYYFYAYNLPTNGLQNGAPDGLVLDYQGTIIQFLSYEGTFTAVDGIALDAESTDIGVTETGSTLSGTSLQLCCIGSLYEDMTWQASATETVGTTNLSQVLPVTLQSFTGHLRENDILLNWITLTELNNDYFVVEKSSDGNSFNEIGRIDGNGTSNRPINYSFIDKSASDFNFYRLKQVDFDGTSTTYETILVKTILNVDLLITPNPASDILRIKNSNALLKDQVTLVLYDLAGGLVLKEKVTFENGAYELDVTNLKKGVYHISLDDQLTRYRQKIIIR